MHNVSVLNAADPLAGESLFFTLSGITGAVFAFKGVRHWSADCGGSIVLDGNVLRSADNAGVM